MDADSILLNDGDEIWSNWICPGCRYWHGEPGRDEGWTPTVSLAVQTPIV